MSEWPEEHSKALTEFLSRGMSRAKIAAAINGQFDTSYTRNAVIGRAGRMQLVGPAKPPRETKPRKRSNYGPETQKLNRKRQGDHHSILKISNGGNGSLRVTRSTYTDVIPDLRCVEVVPLNLTLAELDQATRCHYIPGDDLRYCGHPSMAGSSYCAPHKFLCAGYETVSKRSTYREFAA